MPHRGRALSSVPEMSQLRYTLPMMQIFRPPFRAFAKAPLIAALGVLGLCVLVTFGSATGLEAEGADDGFEGEPEGKSLMERGADLFLEGLRREMEPALDEAARLLAEIGPSMRRFLAEMGPALAEIAEQVEDWSLYERPEVLDNGDIIIRRKVPVPNERPSGDIHPGELREQGEGDAPDDGSIEL